MTLQLFLAFEKSTFTGVLQIAIELNIKKDNKYMKWFIHTETVLITISPFFPESFCFYKYEWILPCFTLEKINTMQR